MICWQCHEPTQSAVCVGCGVIQPPPPDPDPFVILGLERRFHLTEAEIDDKWRAVSRLVHPDRFTSKPAVLRRMSLQWTAAINGARRDLRDPDRRARLLATGDPNPPETNKAPADADFLEMVFELQMGANADPEGTRQRATELRDRERTRLDEIFSAWEANGEPLYAVEQILGRIRFLQTAITQTLTE